METIKKNGYDFSFAPDACSLCSGFCCTGSSGYVWVTVEDIEKISLFLKIEPADFKTKFVKHVSNGRLSLRELKKAGIYNCVLFDSDKGICRIYEVRPNQCTTFPFWERFKTHINEVFMECPGIVLKK